MARSRYSALRDVGGALESWRNPAAGPHDDADVLEGVPFVEHTVAAGERLDVLAARYLGDGRYHWVIAMCNGLSGVVSPAPGTRLRVPERVQDVLARLLP